MKLTKRRITLLVGIPLSIIFLWIALRGVDFKEAFSLVKKADYRLILLAALMVIADFSLRALRWKVLLSPVKIIKYIELLSTVFIGFMANNVLPLRAGEVIRIFLIGQKENISKTSAVGTIVIERMLDIFAILSLSIIAFAVHSFPPYIKKIWIIFLLILVVLIIILYGLMYSEKKTLYILNKTVLRFLPEKFEKKTATFLNDFIGGLHILKSGHHLILSLVISLAIWGINALGFYFVAQALGLSQVAYSGALLVMTFVALGISIPSSPGFVGVYEAAGIGAALLLGVAKTEAGAFIMFIHVVQILTILAVGMLFLTREHISLLQVEKEAEKEV